MIIATAKKRLGLENHCSTLFYEHLCLWNGMDLPLNNGRRKETWLAEIYIFGCNLISFLCYALLGEP